MKKTLLFALSLLTALTSYSDSDPCLGTINSAPPSYDSLETTVEERIKSLCDFRAALTHRYAPIDLKRELKKIDVHQEINSCIRIEQKTTEHDLLSFIDRSRTCAARIDDSHLDILPHADLPHVYNGFSIEEVDGKFYISGYDSKLFAFLIAKNPSLTDLKKDLQLGAEIISIDGMFISQLIQKMKLFFSASSEEFALKSALRALSYRNHNYPTKGHLDIVLNIDGRKASYQIPWWSDNSAQKSIANDHLKRLGLLPLDLLEWKYNGVDKKFDTDYTWIDTKIYSSSKPLIKEYFDSFKDDSGKVGLVLGQDIFQGRPFCYLQLKTFSTEKWTPLGEDTKFDFSSPIRDFIVKCNEEKQAPLILDLRYNAGGNFDLPPKIHSLLAEKDKTYPGPVYTFLNNRHTSRFLDSEKSGLGQIAYSKSKSSIIWTLEALAIAKRDKTKFLPLIKSDPIKTDSIVRGYTQKIVALVTSECVSACDLLAKLFESNKNVTLVGSHTNGTGAGSMSRESDSTWINEPFRLIKSPMIPNMLFGVQEEITEGRFLNYEKNKHLIMENRPVVAKVQYKTTLEDIKTGGKGWIRKAVEVLYSLENESTNTVEVKQH